MNIIFNKQTKAVYFFEIFFFLVIVVLIGLSIFYISNPEFESMKVRDADRISDLNKIMDEGIIKYFAEQNNQSILEEIELCSDGWTEITKQLLEEFLVIDIGQLKDPLTESPKIGYEICKSRIPIRVQLRAPLAELEKIEIGKRIEENIKNQNL